MEKETLEEAAEKYAKRSSSAVFQELHAFEFSRMLVAFILPMCC